MSGGQRILAVGFGSVAVFAVFVAVVCLSNLRAQDANTGGASTTGKAIVPMQGPPQPGDPGQEGEVRITTHKIFSYHLGSWGWSPRFPMPPAETDPTPDTP